MVPPRWAHDPLSGEGAKQHGGRFNAAGQPAFYSALDPHTAYAEYTQNLFDRPGLLCAFDVDGGNIADLRGDGAARWGLSDALMHARWIGLTASPTQQAGQAIKAAGFDGAIYRSLQHSGGSNLVLWRWNERGSTKVVLRDRLGEAIVDPI